MGTVGLSFGSPTSGTGFDVSSTVATIVANLQKVETPWKNQLTALQSQDTAISSLGSLFSTLSTDVGQLTDFEGVLAQKTGSSSDTNVLELTSASSSATAGTHTIVVNNLAQTSSGYLAPIASASDTLSGSITLNVGTGTAQTFSIASLSDQTLAGLAAAINQSGVGINASVLTDSSGSRLSLVSATSGGSGDIAVTANSITDATTSGGTLAYTAAVPGKDASLNVDGVDLSSASNTVTNLIPGLTFQLLAASPQQTDGTAEPVQVVIANDNSGVESAVNQFVTDYNSLIKAINTQQGNDSSGNPEPLFGSPTISLLQSQLLSGLNAQNPNGYLTPVTSADNPVLSGTMTIQAGSGTTYTFAMGDGTSSGDTFYTGSGQNSLSDLVEAINAANIGVTAGVATSNGQSTLTLASQTTGANGALTVNSSIVNTSDTPLAATTVYSTGGQNSSATFASIPNPDDILSGSVTVQVGSGNPVTVNVPDSPDNTLAGLISAISGTAGIGVTASYVTNSDGSESLLLTSGTPGSSGNLTVTSNLLDTTATTGTTLNYTNSSDVGSLTQLGISLNNDGTMTFDSSTLDALLNSDFGSVVGFFQSANSWGQSFAAMLNGSGSSSSTGILALAAKSNSNIESSLNTKISDEDARIATQQTQLTNELNQANEILQELPSQLNGMNELYSAITGYNQQNG